MSQLGLRGHGAADRMFQTGVERRDERKERGRGGWMAARRRLSKSVRGTGAKTRVWFRHACGTRRSSRGLGSRRGPDGVTAVISGSRTSAINLTNERPPHFHQVQERLPTNRTAHCGSPRPPTPAQASAPAARRAGVKVELPLRAEEKQTGALNCVAPNGCENTRVYRCVADNRSEEEPGCRDASPEPG